MNQSLQKCQKRWPRTGPDVRRHRSRAWLCSHTVSGPRFSHLSNGITGKRKTSAHSWDGNKATRESQAIINVTPELGAEPHSQGLTGFQGPLPGTRQPARSSPDEPQRESQVHKDPFSLTLTLFLTRIHSSSPQLWNPGGKVPRLCTQFQAIFPHQLVVPTVQLTSDTAYMEI